MNLLHLLVSAAGFAASAWAAFYVLGATVGALRPRNGRLAPLTRLQGHPGRYRWNGYCP